MKSMSKEASSEAMPLEKNLTRSAFVVKGAFSTIACLDKPSLEDHLEDMTREAFFDGSA